MEEDANEEVTRLQGEIAQLRRRLREQQNELDRYKNARLDDEQPYRRRAKVDHLLWRRCPAVECGVRPQLVMVGGAVYVGGGGGGDFESCRRVQKYVSGWERWIDLPVTPYATFALSSVDGHVTVVGGVNIISSLASRDLIHFDAGVRRWKKTLPPMLTKRYAASATSLGGYLIVTGGIHEDGTKYLETVEVLDTQKLHWSAVASLPKPTTFMSITSCTVTGRIYLLGGLAREGPLRSIFSCTLSDLIHSSPSLVKSRSHDQSRDSMDTNNSQVWEVISEAHNYRTACLAINGKLVVASGLNEYDRTTTSIHVFDPVTRQWEKKGEMAMARTSCSLASFGEGRLMVVGGYVDPQQWFSSLTSDAMECINLYV